MARVSLSNSPTATNWVEKFNALPKGSWIRRAAEHLKGKGKDESSAIPIAVKAAERICSTGDLNFPGLQQVNPKSKAEACAALAVWKAAAARARSARADLAVEAFARIDLTRVEVVGEYVDVQLPDEQRVIDLTARRIAA